MVSDSPKANGRTTMASSAIPSRSTAAAGFFALLSAVLFLLLVFGGGGGVHSRSAPLLESTAHDGDRLSRQSNNEAHSWGGRGGGGARSHKSMSRTMSMHDGAGESVQPMSAFAAAAAPAVPDMPSAEDGDRGPRGDQFSTISRMRAGEARDEALNLYRMNAVQLAAQRMKDASVNPDPTIIKGPLVVKDAGVNAEVPRVDATRLAIEAYVVSAAGFVSENKAWRDAGFAARYLAAKKVDFEGSTQASMKLRVPVDSFDVVLARVREIVAVADAASGAGGGRVVNEWTRAEDVTGRYRDILTRVHIDEVALKRTEELMTAAVTVDEVLRIKHELDMISGRLEQAKGQRKDLEALAVLSTVRRGRSFPATIVPASPQPPRGASGYSSPFHPACPASTPPPPL